MNWTFRWNHLDHPFWREEWSILSQSFFSGRKPIPFRFPGIIAAFGLRNFRLALLLQSRVHPILFTYPQNFLSNPYVRLRDAVNWSRHEIYFNLQKRQEEHVETLNQTTDQNNPERGTSQTFWNFEWKKEEGGRGGPSGQCRACSRANVFSQSGVG